MHSQAVELLYKEHDYILEAIRIGEALLQSPLNDSSEKELAWLISFFRKYADQYHHHKEEDILFKVLEEKNELLGQGIVPELSEHHADFREYLQVVSDAVERKDYDRIKKNFSQYLNELKDHIGVENDELFISADALLSEDEKQKLYFMFMDKDRELGEEKKRDWELQIQARR